MAPFIANMVSRMATRPAACSLVSADRLWKVLSTRVTDSISRPMVLPASRASVLPRAVACTDSSIRPLTSPAACVTRWASMRTSVATTAKPRP